MRLALDARLVGRGLGIATMVRSLTVHLVASDELELVWCGDAALAPPGVAEVVDIGNWPYPLFDSYAGKALLARRRIDLLHMTGNTGWGGAWQPVPFVMTVHDLIFMRTSAAHRSLRQVVGHRYARLNVRRAVRAAQAVAAPSRHTADAIRADLDTAGRIEVIPQGVDQPPKVDAPANGSGHPYAVVFSGRDPRKGVALALHGLRESGLAHWRLKVFAGAGIPDGFLEDAQPELTSGRLELLDYLPRERLHAELAHARALVYPSTDEGFGLPVLDAMAAGVPVITGLAPVTREVAGDAACLIDPSQPAASIAAALRRLDEDSALTAQMVSRGRARATEFSWQRTAERYLQLYKQALGTA